MAPDSWSDRSRGGRAHRVARRLRQLETQQVDQTVAAEKKKLALQQDELAKLKARKGRGRRWATAAAVTTPIKPISA